MIASTMPLDSYLEVSRRAVAADEATLRAMERTLALGCPAVDPDVVLGLVDEVRLAESDCGVSGLAHATTACERLRTILASWMMWAPRSGHDAELCDVCHRAWRRLRALEDSIADAMRDMA